MVWLYLTTYLKHPPLLWDLEEIMVSPKITPTSSWHRRSVSFYCFRFCLLSLSPRVGAKPSTTCTFIVETNGHVHTLRLGCSRSRHCCFKMHGQISVATPKAANSFTDGYNHCGLDTRTGNRWLQIYGAFERLSANCFGWTSLHISLLLPIQFPAVVGGCFQE